MSALVRGGGHCLHLAPSEQKQFSVPCIFTNLCVLSDFAFMGYARSVKFVQSVHGTELH